MFLVAAVTAWVLYGSFLPPNAKEADIRQHPELFKTEEACNTAVKEASAEMDKYVESGDLKGYILKCAKLEVDAPKVVEKKEVKPEVKK